MGTQVCADTEVSVNDTNEQQPSTTETEAPVYNGSLGDIGSEVAPEVIESYWRNRQSQSDKAHAAEVRVLRERLEATSKSAPESTTQGNDMADMVTRLQKELEAERSARVADVRRAKYPLASQALGDEVLAQMDEAKLAGLNEALTPTIAAAPRMDSNNPARRTSGTKDPESMSKEELLAAFKATPYPGR